MYQTTVLSSPQLNFKEFGRQWNFVHVTSSPTYPQSNGKVEAAVNSAKNVMRRSRKARTDP